MAQILEAQQRFVDAIPPGLTLRDGVYSTSDDKIWIPSEADDLKLRIIIIGHCGSAGHRAIDATTKAIGARSFARV